MYDIKSEAEYKAEILNMIGTYCEKFHGSKEFTEGDRIQYAGRVYDSEEMLNLVDSAMDFWLTSGKYTQRFEEEFSKKFGVKYCSLVNSGSSANLLAFMALTSPELGDRCIKRGDEVITVAAAFPTTVAPIVQYGAVPVFIDITIPQYNIDVSKLEEALSDKTKAVMIAHTLGNPFDLKTVKEFCKYNSLWLIEDNCDALGSTYFIDGLYKYTGTIGDIGTSSFYPPHHITMGEGGAVYTNNTQLNRIIRSLRDWGRDCICSSGQDNACGRRFEKQYGELPFGYDHKYVYSRFGYNLKATDMQAAIGCSQLNKVDFFVHRRRHNFNMLKNLLSNVSEKLILPEPCEDSNPSWFGFLITCKDGLDRNKVVRHLEANGIQTRMLFAGNLTKHPCFETLKITETGYRVIGDLVNTDIVMNDSFWVGVYPGITDEMIKYIADKIIEIIIN